MNGSMPPQGAGMRRYPRKLREKAPRQSIKKIFLNDTRLVVKMAKLSPAYLITMIVMGVVQGFMGSAEAVFTVRLFNELDREGATFERAALIIAALAVFYLFAYAITSVYYQFIEPMLGKKVVLRLHKELFEKAQTIDLACYDDPEFYNDFVWAMDEAGGRGAELLADICQIINRLVSAGTLFGLLFSIDIVAAAVILTYSVVSVVVRQMVNRVTYEREREINPLNRKRDYINRVFHLQDYSKEIRLSSASDLLLDEMDENTEERIGTVRKYGKKFFVLNSLCNDVLAEGVYFALILYLLFKLLDGSVLIGSFSATIGMIWRVRWMLNDFVNRITKFPQHSMFLEKYYGFLSYKPKTNTHGDAVGDFDSLELENVSFAYDFSANREYVDNLPGSDNEREEKEVHTVLEGVNMTLRKGEKIAIVGYNGAGKTTLIKLLMRLYDPTSGRITMNGKDIREFDSEEYRKNIGVVFQDYKLFAASIAENVMNGIYDEKTDRETVLHSLDAAGFSDKLEDLKNGIDTHLTREFDDEGTNLSGGEAQKVVIARVFAKPYKLIIMDEPSSALDPVAEYELNQSILKYAQDKTVIFISHRLSTTRFADRIYMFDKGHLIESGSHDELITQGGKYAQMFNMQAEKYRK